MMRGYNYFNMLKSLKYELVRGSSPLRSSPNGSSASSTSGGSVSSVEDSEDESDDERNMETDQTIQLFRMHLKGLVDIMNRLSDSSQLITRTYQKNIRRAYVYWISIAPTYSRVDPLKMFNLALNDHL